MDISKVMPIWFGISIFLGFFMGALGIYAARAIALCLRDVYEATGSRKTRPSVWRHITTEAFDED